MPIECYTTVSDLAICQRCPALLAYKIHRRYKSVWQVGIKGTGEFYGSAFHKEISEKFFRAASNPKSPLYNEINSAAYKGADELEKLVREKFFLPFVEAKEKYFKTEQILAMARAVRTWIQGMLIFFEDSRPVFLKPEEKLQGVYNSQDSKLIITGRYDALIFNPNRIEMRLFEFKGFKKSDITVPLSQSLIYAWLIYKSFSIIPSIEIIYLDEKKPEIFNFKTVRDMIISGLPGLFNSALDIILLRRLPEIMQDKNLCGVCKFKDNCKDDMKKIFSSKFKTKRRGASLLSLMVFFFAAILITAQVFFFSNLSSESVREDRDVQSVRMQLAAQVDELIEYIRQNKIQRLNNRTRQYGDSPNHPIIFDTDITIKNCEDFYSGGQDGNSGAVGTLSNFLLRRLRSVKIDVFTLDYTYEVDSYTERPMNERIFPPMKDHYLIRVHKAMPFGNNFMLQVLVKSNDHTFKTINYEEIWF